MSEHIDAGKRKPKSFSELYPGRFLHADHLGTKQQTLTISDVDVEELNGEKGKQAKAILAFERTPLLLVLAKLNGQCLKAMFGANVQEWVGKKVTFFATDKIMPMNGEACIRVWGSPDIAKDMDLEIPMPRRKAVKMTLHAVQKAGGAAPAAKPAADDGAPDGMPR